MLNGLKSSFVDYTIRSWLDVVFNALRYHGRPREACRFFRHLERGAHLVRLSKQYIFYKHSHFSTTAEGHQPSWSLGPMSNRGQALIRPPSSEKRSSPWSRTFLYIVPNEDSGLGWGPPDRSSSRCLEYIHHCATASFSLRCLAQPRQSCLHSILRQGPDSQNRAL